LEPLWNPLISDVINAKENTCGYAEEDVKEASR
jgi:hypothetical protein